MHKDRAGYVYSPSDLNAFLENEAVTWLDRYNQEFPRVLTRDESMEEDEIVQAAGEKHEQAILESYQAQTGVTVIERSKDALGDTLAALKAGRDVVYQARLQHEGFAGWADFLIRVEGNSGLGGWHYEVWDTKLARSMKPYFAIQLCCYSEMLESIQGRRPQKMGIILGNGERRSLLVSDYWFYYKAIKRAFLEQQASFDPKAPLSFPGLADYRHWTGHVNKLLEDRDDVSLVANIRAVQVEKLATAVITTLHGLAKSSLPNIPKISRTTFDRLRAQARIQVASKPGQPPAFKVLPVNPEAPRHGFGLLPPESANDVCFDIEGYPLIEGGLEYLLGVTCREHGQRAFKDWWAHGRGQEKASFESFVDWVHGRWQKDPSMHVYHYAAYETTALKRLMCRYASRENEVDDLLRNQVFVDLYTVVRQALLIGEPSYSLKNVEHLYMPKRERSIRS